MTRMFTAVTKTWYLFQHSAVHEHLHFALSFWLKSGLLLERGEDLLPPGFSVQHGGHSDLLCLGDLHQTGWELDHGEVPGVSAHTDEESLRVRRDTVCCPLVYLVSHHGAALVLNDVPALQPAVSPTGEEQRGSGGAPAAVRQHLERRLTVRRSQQATVTSVPELTQNKQLSVMSSDHTRALQSPTVRKFWTPTLEGDQRETEFSNQTIKG